MTSYLVLRETAEGWIVLDATQAASADAAIRKFVENEGTGTYVAVPERSWNPRPVKVEQAVKVSFGSAT